MEFLKSLKAEIVLRIGIALMYVYSGLDLIRHPNDWVGYVPQWVSNLVTTVVPIETFLLIQGIGELAIAAVLLAWFLPRIAVRIGSTLAFVEMASILAFVGINLVTFRDIGLCAAALALVILTLQSD